MEERAGRTAALAARVEELSATTARLAGVVGATTDPGPVAVANELERRRTAIIEHADALVRAAGAMVLELRALEAAPQLLEDGDTAERLAGLESEVEDLVTALEAIVEELEAISSPSVLPTSAFESRRGAD